MNSLSISVSVSNKNDKIDTETELNLFFPHSYFFNNTELFGCTIVSYKFVLVQNGINTECCLCANVVMQNSFLLQHSF